MAEGCKFCEIIRGERPADFIYRDETLVVFRDIYPSAPIHYLVVPTKHIRSINDLTEEDGRIIAAMILKAKEIAKEAGISRDGYKLLFNVELGGGQVIFHLHMHLFGGWQTKPHRT
jgi:histidine triad (HIT) family protein